VFFRRSGRLSQFDAFGGKLAEERRRFATLECDLVVFSRHSFGIGVTKTPAELIQAVRRCIVQAPKLGENPLMEVLMVSRDDVELLGARAILWRMVIEIFRRGHKLRFPRHHQLGADLQMYFVFGAATVLLSQRKPVRPSTIGRYIQIPRETVRRHLAMLTSLGLLEREGHTYSFGARGKLAPQAERFVDAVVNAAGQLF
jgi:hypothetical protein